MDLSDTFNYDITNPKDLQSIKTGAALICEMAYQKKIISYSLEDSEAVKKEKNALTKASGKLEASKLKDSNDKILICVKEYDADYKAFLLALEKAIQESERR